MKISFKRKNPIFTSESTNFLAWNFWTSHYWILLKHEGCDFMSQLPSDQSDSFYNNDQFQSSRSRNLRFQEPYHSIEKISFIEQIKVYKNNFAPLYGFQTLKLHDRPDWIRSVLHYYKNVKRVASEPFGNLNHITQSFKRFQ